MLGMARWLGRTTGVPANVHARTASVLAAGSAGRRVPTHLTMTLDELLAAKDTRATHRMVERGVHAPAEQKRTARVPVHLTMTLEELLAAEDKCATHRMVQRGVKAPVEL